MALVNVAHCVWCYRSSSSCWRLKPGSRKSQDKIGYLNVHIWVGRQAGRHPHAETYRGRQSRQTFPHSHSIHSFHSSVKEQKNTLCSQIRMVPTDCCLSRCLISKLDTSPIFVFPSFILLMSPLTLFIRQSVNLEVQQEWNAGRGVSPLASMTQIGRR